MTKPLFAAVTLAALSLLPVTSHAAHWKELGWSTAAAAGLVYVDLDSIHVEGSYRIARFLTIYATPATNANGIKMDRILQETAFDCDKQRFTFLSTVGYFAGKKVGGSSPADDWQDKFRSVPLDSYSQHAYSVTCNSPIAAHPDLDTAQGESPGTVKLPGPGAPRSQPPPPSNK